jgi:hypothetical protein
VEERRSKSSDQHEGKLKKADVGPNGKELGTELRLVIFLLPLVLL